MHVRPAPQRPQEETGPPTSALVRTSCTIRSVARSSPGCRLPPVVFCLLVGYICTWVGRALSWVQKRPDSIGGRQGQHESALGSSDRPRLPNPPTRPRPTPYKSHSTPKVVVGYALPPKKIKTFAHVLQDPNNTTVDYRRIDLARPLEEQVRVFAGPCAVPLWVVGGQVVGGPAGRQGILGYIYRSSVTPWPPTARLYNDADCGPPTSFLHPSTYLHAHRAPGT